MGAGMTDKIEPALRHWLSSLDTALTVDDQRGLWNSANGQPEDPHTVIQIANAALPDSDFRKITREQVDALMLTLLNEPSAFGDGRGIVYRLADALDSYVPREKTLADHLDDGQRESDMAEPAMAGYTGLPCTQCGRIRVYIRRDGQLQCEKCETIQ